jgi:hypothetical protein
MDGNRKENKNLVSDSNGKQHCLRILTIGMKLTVSKIARA